jgi:hypothetical protein
MNAYLSRQKSDLLRYLLIGLLLQVQVGRIEIDEAEHMFSLLRLPALVVLCWTGGREETRANTS